MEVLALSMMFLFRSWIYMIDSLSTFVTLFMLSLWTAQRLASSYQLAVFLDQNNSRNVKMII